MIAATAWRAFALSRGGALVGAYAALLIAWGNAKTILLEPTATLPGGSAALVLAGAALVALSLASARTAGLDALDLGLRRRALRGGAIGLLLGIVASVAGVAALRVLAPLVVGHPIEYAPLGRLSGSELAVHVAVLLPLSVVLPEEIAFRGVLLAALARPIGLRGAIVASAGAFALWHGAIVLGTIGQTTLGAASPWTPIAIVSAIVVVAAGGVIFAWLRLATGSLVTTIAAHWAFNVIVLVGLWATRAG